MRKQLLTAALATVLGISAVAGAQVYVRVGPPPPPREVIPVNPHPGWVWRAGYHRWDGNQYVWVPGSYAAPPRPGAFWVPGHWRNTRHGYVWIDGHWR